MKMQPDEIGDYDLSYCVHSVSGYDFTIHCCKKHNIVCQLDRIDATEYFDCQNCNDFKKP